MKSYILILMLLCCISTFGQTTSGLTITGQKWRITRIVSTDHFVNSSDVDMGATQQRRDWADNVRQNDRNAKQGLPTEPRPQPARGSAPQPSRVPVKDSLGKNIYIYEVIVENSGDKTVQSITWEYIFYERDTKRELGRQRFTSKKEIRPGKQKKLVMRSALPPVSVIDVTTVGNKAGDQYSEEVVIVSVEYIAVK